LIQNLSPLRGQENVYLAGNRWVATLNLTPGTSVYGERLIKHQGKEYRLWDPNRSKLAALLLKKTKIPLKEDSTVLYLGAASGTTASHISDIAREGLVYAVEFARKPMRDLVKICQDRKNLLPILADCRKPQSYQGIVERVDLIYQDIAQPQQAEIANKNSTFLKKNGHLVLILKARSINSLAEPKKILEEELEVLQQAYQIKNVKSLAPRHQDHYAVIAHLML